MKITGPWESGYVLDWHIISSVPTGHPYRPFYTKRTELGELVYGFKYRGETNRWIIADTAEDFIRNRWPDLPLLDCVAPAPPSLERSEQPVVALAKELAARLKVPVYEKAVIKARRTQAMKDIPPEDRSAILDKAIQRGTDDVKNKRVLLFDDLFGSGATLRRVTEILLKEGGASTVHALALTRTK